jgi:hypothetical protein
MVVLDLLEVMVIVSKLKRIFISLVHWARREHPVETVIVDIQSRIIVE